MTPLIDLNALVDLCGQPFVLINHRREVVLTNRAFEETYGVARADAVGRACYELIASPGRPVPCGGDGSNCPFAAAFHGNTSADIARVFHDLDGREHLARVTAHPLHTQGGDIYVGELIAEEVRPAAPGNEQCPGTQMVGESPVFLQALNQLRAAAASDAPVLLQGETGTGKELAANYIHRHSARRNGPFQTLDCTALTEELFESEVFGHTRGAFTGSAGAKPGLFELADKGTLFLDEIGELPAAQQSKLLRVLETGTFRPVGGLKTYEADVRIVCATNRQLQGAASFRSDLYYRIACLTIRLPRLVERRTDIPLLAEGLLKHIGQSAGLDFRLTASAHRQLQAYDYPGNVRELRNILWLAAVNSPDGRIAGEQVTAALPRPSNLSCQLSAAASVHAADPAPGGARPSGQGMPPKPPPRHVWEAEHLALLLHHHNGSRRAVAEELGVSERTVYRKLRQFGLIRTR